MLNTLVVSAVALAGTAIAQSAGSAVVINSCNYPVYLQNTPSAGGGFSTISKTLNSGDTYNQEYTQLTNGNGWSIKLADSADSDFQSNIMQYEYTWLGAGTIWYDLSDVNGNPWDGNWELSATGDCTPRQAAYQFSTDDAYGEQSCPGSSSVTVTLCSGNSGSGGSPQESQQSQQSTPAATSTQAPVPTSTPAPVTSQAPQTTSSGGFPFNFGGFGDKVAAGDAAAATPTTFATVVTSAANRGGVTVTEVATAIVTNFVTATAGPVEVAARHEHVARHAHHHHF